MALFSFGKKDKVIKELSEENTELKKLAADNTSFQNMALQNIQANFNRNIAVYPKNTIYSHVKRYIDTDDIYSIVRKLAETAARVPLYAYLQTPDVKSFQLLTREVKGYKNPLKYKSLQTKALTDLPDNDPVAALIESPNPDMSKFEFYDAIYSFLCVFGECFILKERPSDGVNQGLPVQLNLMYPQYVIVKISQTLPRKIVGFDYRINGQMIRENIPVEDVIHIKYFNPEVGFLGEELRGLSPLVVLKKRLTRLDSNMDTTVAQMQNGGVETIVYDKSDTGQTTKTSDGKEVTVAGQRKDNFYRFMSNPANAGAPFFASGEMGSIQLGSHLADLGVAELANVDFKKLCNAYGVSDILFNSDSAATESNVALMTKMLYTNVILPNVYRVRDALIRGLLPDFKDGVLIDDGEGDVIRIKGDGKLRFIDADISDITELHEDLGKRATWMQAAYWLTPNEKREMMNYEKYDDALFDQPLIPTGIQSLSDFEILPPIEPDIPNGN